MSVSKLNTDLRLVEEEEAQLSEGGSALAAGVESALEGDVRGLEPEAKPEIVIYGEKELVIDGCRQKFVLRDFSYQDGTGYEGRYPARLWVPVDDDGNIVDLASGLLADQPADERDEWDRRGVHPDLVGFWEGKKFGRLRGGRVVYDKKAQTITVHLPVRRGDALSEEALDEGFCLQGAWGGERNVRAVRQDFDVKKMLPAEFHARFVRPHCPDDEDDNPFVWASRRAKIARGYLVGVKNESSDWLETDGIDEIYQALAQRKFNIATQDAFEPKGYELNQHNLALCGKVGKHFRLKRKEGRGEEDHRADLTYFVLECGESLTSEMFDDLKVLELLDNLENCFAQGLNVSRMVALFKRAMGAEDGRLDAARPDAADLQKRGKGALVFTLEMVVRVFGGYISHFDKWCLEEDFDLAGGFEPERDEERAVALLLGKTAKANFENAAAVFQRCREIGGLEGVESHALVDFAAEVALCFPGEDESYNEVISWGLKTVLAMAASERNGALKLLAQKLHGRTYVYRQNAFNGWPNESYEFREADAVRADIAKMAAEQLREVDGVALAKYERDESDRKSGMWGVHTLKPRDQHALVAKAVDKARALTAGFASNVQYLPSHRALALPQSATRAALCAFSREGLVSHLLAYRDSRRCSGREKVLFFRCIEPFLPEFVGDESERIVKIVRGLAEMRTVAPDFLPYLGVVSGGGSREGGYFKSGLCEYFHVASSSAYFDGRNEDNDRYNAQIEELVVEILTMAKEGAIDFEDALDVLQWLSERPDYWKALKILEGKVRAFRSVMLQKCYPSHYGPQLREQLLDGDVAATLQNELGMAKLAYLRQVLAVLPLARDYAVATREPQNFRSVFARLVENGRRKIVVERRGDCVDYEEIFPRTDDVYRGCSYQRRVVEPKFLNGLFEEGLIDRAAFEAKFADLKDAHALEKECQVLCRVYGDWISITERLFSDVPGLVEFLSNPDHRSLLLQKLPNDGTGPLKSTELVSKLLAIFERGALEKVREYVGQRWPAILSDADFVGVLREAKIIVDGDGGAAEFLNFRLAHAYTLTLELLARCLSDFSASLRAGKASAIALVNFFEGMLRGQFLERLAKIWQKSPEFQVLLPGMGELFGERFERMGETVIDGASAEEHATVAPYAVEISRFYFGRAVDEGLDKRDGKDLVAATKLVLVATFNALVEGRGADLKSLTGPLEALQSAEGNVGLVRETVRRAPAFARERMEALTERLRVERIKAFGMLPFGGKIHLARDVDSETLKSILAHQGMSSTGFWVDGSKCAVLPAVPSSGEFVAVLKALAAQGLLKNNQATSQLCAVPELDAFDGAVVGSAMVLRTKKPLPLFENVLETSHDPDTGRRILINGAGGYMANLPFMPKGGHALGRTDIVGRIAFSDADLWQFLRTMHRDKDGGIFNGMWAEFVDRYLKILKVREMPEVINDSWILPKRRHFGTLRPDEKAARARGQAEHFATLKRCTDAAFAYMRNYEETGEMNGVIYEIILLCNEMIERMRDIQAMILGFAEFREERKLLLGSEAPISRDEFFMHLQKV